MSVPAPSAALDLPGFEHLQNLNPYVQYPTSKCCEVCCNFIFTLIHSRLVSVLFLGSVAGLSSQYLVAQVWRRVARTEFEQTREPGGFDFPAVIGQPISSPTTAQFQSKIVQKCWNKWFPLLIGSVATCSVLSEFTSLRAFTLPSAVSSCSTYAPLFYHLRSFSCQRHSYLTVVCGFLSSFQHPYSV